MIAGVCIFDTIAASLRACRKPFDQPRDSTTREERAAFR